MLPNLLDYSLVKVRRCPFRSRTPRWNPALPTAIWSFPLRSSAIWNSPLRTGAAHCDLKLPVEVRRWPWQDKANEDKGEEKKEEKKDDAEEKNNKEKEEEEEDKFYILIIFIC